MDKKLKAKWVKALESGKYRRAKGRLQDGEGYCCLGVLCDVSGLESGVDFDPCSSYLPEKFAQQAGLSLEVQRRLALANDGDLLEIEPGASFKSIAKYIRENL